MIDRYAIVVAEMDDSGIGGWLRAKKLHVRQKL